MLPLVSVIVPVYKVKKEYLDECVKSVLNQTIKNVELLLIDDGSPESIGKLCDEYLLKDDRVKVIHKNNGGTASARNLGLENAASNWVTFLDADDWLDIHTFEIINEDTAIYDVIIFNGCQEYVGVSVECPHLYSNAQEFHTRDQLDELQIRSLSVAGKKPFAFCLTSACAKLYKKDFLVENGLKLNAQSYYEDVLFSLDIYESAKRVVYFDQPYYHYRSVKSSKVNSYRANIELEQQQLLSSLFRFGLNNNKSEIYKNAVYLRAIVGIQFCFFQKYYNEFYSGKRRRSSFLKFLDQSPYKEALSETSLSDLNLHFKIKYLCFKYHLFLTLKFVDGLFKLKNKYQLFS